MNANDPLLPAPDAEPWMISPRPGEDPIRASAAGVVDYFFAHQLRWPARNAEGELMPPPPEHVLDCLARAFDLVSEDDIQTHPEAGTVAVVSRLHPCGLCGAAARYDGYVQQGASRLACFMCPRCFDARSSGVLGVGENVYLLQMEEVPAEVRAICDELTGRQGRPSLWSADN